MFYLQKPYILLTIVFLFIRSTVYAAGVTPEEIDESLRRGIEWSVEQQSANGGWEVSYTVGTTAMGVTALGHYAEQLGVKPLSNNYEYSDQTLAGLNYIFTHARYDAEQEMAWFGGETVMQAENYAAGPAMMAIAISQEPDRIVDVQGSELNGLSYRDVVQLILNYVVDVQNTSGNGIGAWHYRPTSDIGDLSITGWMTLGLGYARDRFGIDLPQILIDNLDAGAELMQQADNPGGWEYGGAGYSSEVNPPYSDWINMHKVGHLLYVFDLIGESAGSERVQRSVGFLERHWYSPTSGHSGGLNDLGWRGNPPGTLPSYIATVTIMKGLVALGIETLNINGDEFDWYEDVATVIVENQKTQGSWDQGGFPNNYEELSTFWAILTLMRAVPIEEEEEEDIYFIPNAFMPSSHLVENQTFRPSFEETPVAYSLKIFNRWGEEVFSSDDLSDGWDGIYQNNDAPKGTYTYKISFVNSNGREQQIRGALMLVR